MKILIDINLSPYWSDIFTKHQIEAIHWSQVGAKNAPDTELMAWALQNQFVLFTQDLDFGTLLALTHAKGPSVLLLRSEENRPSQISGLVLQSIQQFSQELRTGAIVTIDLYKTRVRALPF